MSFIVFKCTCIYKMLTIIGDANDYGYIAFVVITIRFFPHSWLEVGFVTKVSRLVSYVDQELLKMSEHMNSSLVVRRARVARSLVFRVVFVYHCLPFFFWLLNCLYYFDLGITNILLVSLKLSYFWKMIINSSLLFSRSMHMYIPSYSTN